MVFTIHWEIVCRKFVLEAYYWGNIPRCGYLVEKAINSIAYWNSRIKSILVKFRMDSREIIFNAIWQHFNFLIRLFRLIWYICTFRSILQQQRITNQTMDVFCTKTFLYFCSVEIDLQQFIANCVYEFWAILRCSGQSPLHYFPLKVYFKWDMCYNNLKWMFCVFVCADWTKIIEI